MSYSTELICFSYACSSIADELRDRLKFSGKVLLPPSILHDVNKIGDISFPLFFNIKNKTSQFGRVCGVEEFSSPPGVCHVPYYIMDELGIKEGEMLIIELACPVKGTFLKLKPHQTEFTELSNPKALLEKIMSRDYPTVSKNHTIAIFYKELNRIYYLDVIETEPAPVIQIINADINLEFDKPLDYVEHETVSEENEEEETTTLQTINSPVAANSTASSNDRKYASNKRFIPFSGKGNRLGGNT